MYPYKRPEDDDSMKKSNMILPILQTVLTSEEVESIVQTVGYVDKARKFTVYHLLQYWVTAASEEWSGYRFAADHAACSGLSPVHYSCFSGKAADVPFTVCKELLQLLVRKCNRETRRKLAFPKKLLLIDSTTMTGGKTRLPWAPYHGDRAAVKQTRTTGSLQTRWAILCCSASRQCSLRKTVCVATASCSTFSDYSGYHLPVGTPPVSFKAASSCRHIS